MSRGRRLTALLAVAFIGVAGLISAAQIFRDLGDQQAARFLAQPAVVTSQGALRPVEGRPLEWWGKPSRRSDRAMGSPAAAALAACAILLAAAVAVTTDDGRLRVALARAAQERAPPLQLVH